MRPHCVLISIGLLLITVFPLYSQQQGLRGTWTVDLARTLKEMSTADKNSYDSLPERVKGNFAATFQNRQFRFNDNAETIISFQAKGNPVQVTGTWSYASVEDKLTITAGGITQSFIVEWQDAFRIKLKYKDISAKAILSSLCLTRNP